MATTTKAKKTAAKPAPEAPPATAVTSPIVDALSGYYEIHHKGHRLEIGSTVKGVPDAYLVLQPASRQNQKFRAALIAACADFEFPLSEIAELPDHILSRGFARGGIVSEWGGILDPTTGDELECTPDNVEERLNALPALLVDCVRLTTNPEHFRLRNVQIKGEIKN